MSATWRSDDEPKAVGPQGVRDWLRVLRRGSPLALVVFGCLGLMLVLRLVERPLFGLRRPVTPWLTRFVCSTAFLLLGIRRKVTGTPIRSGGAVVSNHASWLDIFALNAAQNVYFVSKAEVAGWPGIGWLARATGTVFINRDRKEARSQAAIFRERLAAGHVLLFFPEGTSTDGQRVLPFKATLFQAFFDPGLAKGLKIQPVTVVYRAPAGEDPRFYGWWGDMDFGPSLLAVLAMKHQGAVHVTYHAPIPVAECSGRKDLAQRCETLVRSALQG
jgi:1-acyl-sn-glycerol-3-phosphate acyltransferase